ncbi:DUF6493 family protein [Spongiactinospora sp. TRM90649]|uniref:DUF7824 domain-containing protein n=1 Tax=Spongiactinospora sp. TRM90649 TaxID=3031114 RepID=UPI0023F6C3F6|nr:DUF6493 family protein [Spongiactinospora sp. TRM90649]MDF5758666.1 DUF6493 family protein [Spongiactinospora sp. TRM90649]
MTTNPPDGGAWPRVRAAIARGRLARLANTVLTLDEAERRAVAAELPGHIGAARQAHQERARRSRTWSDGGEWIEPMRVAGAGTIGGAAAVATWLYRRDFTRWRRGRDIAPLLQVITARPQEWQADLAVRLALRLRGTPAQARDDSVPLALELLRRTGVVPPEHDPLVTAWVSQPPDLANDPLTPHLVPRLFEAEGVGRALREDTLEPPAWNSGGHTWLAALRDEVAAGRLAAEPLVEGCVRRFLYGGTGPDLRFFVRLHELLAPEPDGEHTRDYLRLLPAAPGPVAELALRRLRGAGRLTGDDVEEAVSALLFRAEGKLVRAGLTLLEQAARETPGDLDHLAGALGSAFLCESYQVRERAVRLAVKHAARFTPVGAEAVRTAAEALPADLAARLSEAYGVTAAEPEQEAADAFEPGELPPFEPLARDPFPPPLTDLTATYDRVGDGVTFERWLDAFVRDPSPRPCPGQGRIYRRRHWSRLKAWTEALLREAADPGAEPPLPAPEPPQVGQVGQVAQLCGVPVMGVVRRFVEISRYERGVPGEQAGASADRLPEPGWVSAPVRIMLARCAEVLAALKAGTLPPYLLATPTLTSGHIDPAVLVDRLEGYERAGALAMPADLGQALLRLPREADPEVIGRAGRLTSEAGLALARWLADRPEPETRVDWSHANGKYTHDRQKGEHGPRLRPRIKAEPTGFAMLDELLSDPPSATGDDYRAYMESWRLTLPSDREAVAMHLMPYLLNVWPRPGGFHEYVAALFSQDGPVGEGTALLIAVQLTEHGMYAWPERGLRLLLGAAATGCLPAAEVGRQLGLCLRRDVARLRDVRAALEQCAGQGAHREVWQIMSGLLSVYLPGPDERPNTSHTQALALASEAAHWAGVRGTLPAIEEAAARKGTSGFVRTARALHERLLAV